MIDERKMVYYSYMYKKEANVILQYQGHLTLHTLLQTYKYEHSLLLYDVLDL